MAEAHQAVAFQFQVTDEGISLHFDKAAVKAALLSFFGIYRRRLLKARTALYRGIFPASPLSLAVILGLVVLLALLGVDPTYGVLPLMVSISQYVPRTYMYVCLLACPYIVIDMTRGLIKNSVEIVLF